MTGEQIQAEAFKMFEKWCEMFAPADFDGDTLDLTVLYLDAPPEQHKAAAEAAGLKDPRYR